MRHRISRNNKFLIAIGGVTVLAILLVAFAYARTESERIDIQVDSRQASNLWAESAALTSDVDAQQSAIDDYLLSADPLLLGKYQAAVADETSVASAMSAGAADLPGLDHAVANLEAATASWRTAFARPAIAAVGVGGAAPHSLGLGSEEDSVHTALAALTAQLNLAEDALRQREDALAATRTAATVFGLGALVLSALLSLWLIRKFGYELEKDAVRAGILNRFTETTSFATDDTAIARANLEALTLLVHPDAGVTHILNASRDRGIPEATMGGAEANVIALQAVSTCSGMIRGAMYVSSDLAAPLSVHCPVYPADHGTLACVPLVSGESIGVVHLYWETPRALPIEIRRSVAQIAAHAALTIGNRHLLDALRDQASTDARTGLANSRAFDLGLEYALASRGADESISVLMLDLDHFKRFNDRHGHPAGDEALRTFAEVLRSCMRDGDLAARYGGEEFAVMLPKVGPAAAMTIAQRIRERTESTIVSLSPGITGRITVSIGIAAAPIQALEQLSLLRLADEALYQAKASGRNRVVYLGQAAPEQQTVVEVESVKPADPPDPERADAPAA
jgi:diguanylate cyclase (GGDEF)-like protein